MNKTWRNAGLIALGVGVLSYPAFLLYKYIAKKRSEAMDELSEGEEPETKTKSFSPAYRGRHKPHHRKAEANGHVSEGLA